MAKRKRTYTRLTIQPDGTVEVELQKPKPSLALMQEAVGGYIEPVDFFLKRKVWQHIVAYCNEEFAYRDPRPNLLGTRAVGWHHMLSGPIFIFFSDSSEKARKHFESILNVSLTPTPLTT